MDEAWKLSLPGDVVWSPRAAGAAITATIAVTTNARITCFIAPPYRLRWFGERLKLNLKRTLPRSKPEQSQSLPNWARPRTGVAELVIAVVPACARTATSAHAVKCPNHDLQWLPRRRLPTLA